MLLRFGRDRVTGKRKERRADALPELAGWSTEPTEVLSSKKNWKIVFCCFLSKREFEESIIGQPDT